jgi:hypothetical protein
MRQGLHYVKEKSQPWIDINRRGQILILFAVTYFVLFLRALLFFFSGIDFLWFISPDYISFDYMSYINEGGLYFLNLIAFVLVFFWVSRIVFSDVRKDIKQPLTNDERFNFILVSSVCLLTLNFALDVSALFTSPFIVLCSGFFLILWIVSIIMDKAVLNGTYLRLYFKYLILVVVGVILIDILVNFIIKEVNS